MYQVEKNKYYKVTDKTNSLELFYIRILEIFPDIELEYAEVSGLCIIFDDETESEIFFTIDSCRHFSLDSLDKKLDIEEITKEIYKQKILEYAQKL